jgi:hypothetical protein
MDPYAVASVLYLQAVLGIQIRIWIRIRMFLGLLDPHPYPLVRAEVRDPDPYQNVTDAQHCYKGNNIEFYQTNAN